MLKISTTVVKVQTYCPKEHVEAVRKAMSDAGAGKLGNYSHGAFVSKGTGYFMPLADATPTIGKQGKLEKVAECKIESSVGVEYLEAVIAAIKTAHPYEEACIDILPTLYIE